MIKMDIFITIGEYSMFNNGDDQENAFKQFLQEQKFKYYESLVSTVSTYTYTIVLENCGLEDLNLIKIMFRLKQSPIDNVFALI